MDALLIREQRQDERMSAIEDRLAKVETILKAAGISPVSMRTNITPRSALMALISEHASEEDIRQASFDLGIDDENFKSDGKMAMARELYKELQHQSRLYMLTGWLQQRVPNVDWPSV